jgi:hypothetical protein
MELVTKAESPLLTQLDLANSQYAGIVEDAMYCLIALYLKIKRIFLRARRRYKTPRRNPEEILVGSE